MVESSSCDSRSMRSEAAKRRRLDEELLLLLDAESSTGSSASSSSDSSSSRDDDDDLTLYESLCSSTCSLRRSSDRRLNRTWKRRLPRILTKSFAETSDCHGRLQMHLLPNSRSRRTTLQEETAEGLPPESPEEHVRVLSKLCNKLRRVKLSYVLADAPRQRTHRIDRVLAEVVLEEKQEIRTQEKLSNDFKQVSVFPDTIGCIDGSYIPVRCPAGKVRSVYVNRHHYPFLDAAGNMPQPEEVPRCQHRCTQRNSRHQDLPAFKPFRKNCLNSALGNTTFLGTQRIHLAST
ncbi:hypothetical protein MRX96_027592 [Rhipicephalus microplus]